MLLDIRVFAFADGTDYGAARCCPSGRFPRLASLEVMTVEEGVPVGLACSTGKGKISRESGEG